MEMQFSYSPLLAVMFYNVCVCVCYSPLLAVMFYNVCVFVCVCVCHSPPAILVLSK